MGNIDDNSKPRGAKQANEFQDNRYLAKIRSIPPISDREAAELLTRWRDHCDEKAKRKAIEGSLHLVPPIAKATTKRFRFFGPAFMPTWFELMSAGYLGLCEASVAFKPDVGTPFTHYARRCIRNECVRDAKRLLSAVDRPYDVSTPMDLMLDVTRPDPVAVYENHGGRARPTTGSDSEDEQLRSTHARLRQWPEGWEVKFKKEGASVGAAIFDLRTAGFTLKETADRLDMSLTTVWRRQQAYMETRQ